MDKAMLISYANNMLILVLVLSLPVVITAAVVGTLISILQALTQVQEQTVAFAGKLIAVFITIYLTSSWYGKEIFNFSVAVFEQIAEVSRSGF